MPTYKPIFGKKGKRIQATVRIKGYEPEYKTFDTKTEAKVWATDIENKMKQGTYKKNDVENLAGQQTIKTVGDLIKYFEENEAPNRYSYYEKYKVMYEWWTDKIGNIDCSDLTPAILSDCKRKLIKEDAIKPLKGRKTRGDSTINKYLMALSAILTFGKKEYHLWKMNPMHDVDKRKLPDLRIRFASKDEIEKIKKGTRASSYRLYVFVLIAMTTGGRYNEVRHIKVENIDFKDYRIHYLNTKNNTNRGVPINKKLAIKIKALMRISNIQSGYIFLNDKKTKLAYLKGEFEKVIKDLGIEDFRFHDLRHTAASYLLMAGATIIELMEIFGWKSQAMVRRYAHLSKTHTSNLMNKVSSDILN